MKIFPIPVSSMLQPESQPFRYPRHNDDYGIEQDFHRYIDNNRYLTVQNSAEADWHYLPVYWTRYHLNHDFGRRGIEELQNEVNKFIIDDNRTFTICQYDDGPMVEIGNTTVFLGARKGADGIDVPVLVKPHKLTIADRIRRLRPSRKYLASFKGLLTHPIRQEMIEALAGKRGVFLGETTETFLFVKNLLDSYVALCPRGYGGTSMRFFEAMQLGTVPYFIGARDIRPFKKFINWDEISFYSESAKDIWATLNSVSRMTLLSMGRRSRKVFERHLSYQNWCRYVFKELEYL